MSRRTLDDVVETTLNPQSRAVMARDHASLDGAWHAARNRNAEKMLGAALRWALDQHLARLADLRLKAAAQCGVAFRIDVR